MKLINRIVPITVSLVVLFLVEQLFKNPKQIYGVVPAVLLVIIFYALIAWDPPKVLFSIFFLYVLSGPVLYLKNKIFNKNKKNKAKKKLKSEEKELTK